MGGEDESIEAAAAAFRERLKVLKAAQSAYLGSAAAVVGERLKAAQSAYLGSMGGKDKSIEAAAAAVGERLKVPKAAQSAYLGSMGGEDESIEAAAAAVREKLKVLKAGQSAYLGSMGGEVESIEAAAAAVGERLKVLKAAQSAYLGSMGGKDESIEAAAALVGERLKMQMLKAAQSAYLGSAAAAVVGERLKVLQAAQELLNSPYEEANISMKSRIYLPHDKQLQKGKVALPVLPKFEDPLLAAPRPEEKKEDPFLNIAPKKPNWDLRRDGQKRLDKLERRAQKAMLVLMCI
ncbi:coiled-coil domain-containing protein 12 [Phtheirospermum japonicum]|uniref:Coiled-coil domain-containing protein 12 n=1 Tax=Phtheirospermum japonicum TaxID=374723 RepID=A0A830CIJ9_9LAMI|nr:coiled-coil domain-containing protein 12 [Phtheirospermum japonicum]